MQSMQINLFCSPKVHRIRHVERHTITRGKGTHWTDWLTPGDN